MGIEERKFEEIIEGGSSFLIFTERQPREVQIRSIGGAECKSGESREDARLRKVKNWMNTRAKNFGDVVAYRVSTSNC